ncbi:MAG: ArsR family transcriptional regulator [Caldilineaceae bacterium]|nr:ArsR family transcriptional regulator [Caldilineaceae bacterium]
MHAVRKNILEILKEQRSGATVAELAERLEMAPVSVRHHLDILQGDNLICVERLERKGHVGRPQQVYTLTTEANSYFPNNFAGLADKLMAQIKQVLPPEQVPLAFRSIARQIASDFPAINQGNPDQSEIKALEAHLEQVTIFLSERGYLARWEAATEEGTGEYLLHKYNCPYAGVSGEHPELCAMDQALINELFDEPCQRVESMVDGSPCCTYRITSTSQHVCLQTELPLLTGIR